MAWPPSLFQLVFYSDHYFMANNATPALVAAINKRLYYGWVMLGVSFLGMFASGAGQSFTISVFVNPLIDALDISRTSISSAYTLGTLTAAFGLSYLGRLIDRFGARIMLASVGLLLGLSSIGFSTVANLAGLYIMFTAVRIFGQGSLMLTSNNLASQWFIRRRGLALSIVSLGFAVSSAVYPPVIQALILNIGWRAVWVWVGLFTWALLIPVALILVRDKPEAVGLEPDGGPARLAAPEVGEATNGAIEAPGWTPGEAMRTPQFWIMALSNAVPSMLITGMVFHQISYFGERGLDAQVAANVFTVTAVAMVASGLICGWLFDRLQTRHVMAGALVCMGISMFAMLIATSPLLASLYGVTLGIASGSMMVMSSYIWPQYFGRKHLGGVQGIASTISIIGASLGPLPFGLAFDLLGGYGPALVMLSLLPAVASVAVFFTHPPRHADQTG